MEENKDNGTEEELKIQIDESMFVTGCMGTDNRMKPDSRSCQRSNRSDSQAYEKRQT